MFIKNAIKPAKRSESRSGVRSGYVEIDDGTRLFVRDWGAGNPVLFLSGWALTSDFWCYQMLHVVANGFRAIAYDRRGHGRSSDPGHGYNHETLVRDLACVIETLDLRDVTFVAHSMGAVEASQNFASYGGKHVSRFLMVGTITPVLVRTDCNPAGIDPAELAALLAQFERDFPVWVEKNAPPFFVPKTSPAMIGWGKKMMFQTSMLAVVQLARENAERDNRGALGTINVPTWIIHGNQDVSAPLHLTALPTAALIPGSRLEIYEGAPHGLPLTHQDRLNADLLSFLHQS